MNTLQEDLNFKVFIFTLILGVSAGILGCSENTKPQYQQPQNDIAQRESKDSKNERASLSQLSEEYFVIEKLVESSDVSNLDLAHSKLLTLLFGSDGQSSSAQISRDYRGFLNLFVRLFQKSQKIEKEIGKKIVGSESTDLFYQFFLRDCVEKNSACESIKNLLKRENSTVVLVNHFVQSSKNLENRISLLGIAYDTLGNQVPKDINYQYLKAVFQLISEYEKSSRKAIKGSPVERHFSNFSNLLINWDWTQQTEEETHWFLTLKPWEINKKNKSDIFVKAREYLVRFLPLYSQDNELVRNTWQTYTSSLLNELKLSHSNLDEYPAFRGKGLDSLKVYNQDLVYIVLKVYFGEVSKESGDAFIKGYGESKGYFDQVFEIVQKLVVWDAAQLSLDTNRTLSQRFLARKIRNKDFFQKFLKFGDTLVPDWADFFDIKVEQIINFLSSNQKKLSMYSEEDIHYFFESLRRSVLKTAVYPNMWAIAHDMAKTDWVIKFTVWGWVFSFRGNEILESLFLGTFVKPWFRYATVSRQGGDEKGSKLALIESETLDSLYYFFATGTHKLYKINPDDFLVQLGEQLMIPRRKMLEVFSDLSYKKFLGGHTEVTDYLNWCKRIEATNKNQSLPYPREELDFELLNQHLLPYTKYLKLMSSSEKSNEETLRFFYDDNFGGDFQKSLGKYIPVKEVLDRFKGEVLPLKRRFIEVIDLVARLNLKDSEGKPESLNRSNKVYDDLERLSHTYLGNIIVTHEKVNSCSSVASRESYRRASQLIRNEIAFVKKILFPISQSLSSGTLSLAEAKNYLFEIHHYEIGFQDFFNFDHEDGSLIYSMSKLGFMLRVRQLLISGMDMPELRGSNGEVIVEEFNIPQIIKGKAVIRLNGNYWEDEFNPYIKRDEDATSSSKQVDRTYRMSAYRTAEDWVLDIMEENVDSFRSSGNNETHWTSWDTSETVNYLKRPVEKLMLMVQLYSLTGESYLDVSNRSCLGLDELPSGCIKKLEFDLDLFSDQLMSEYAMVEIDKDREEYLELMDKNHFNTSENVGFQPKFNSNMPVNFVGSEFFRLPYSELAGVYDLALDMMSQPYLGAIFALKIHKVQMLNETKAEGCSSEERNDCRWENEVEWAKNFYISRFEKAGLVFNFDEEILEKQYLRVTNQLNRKFSKIANIFSQGDEQIRRIRKEKGLSFLLDRELGAHELFAYSPEIENRIVEVQEQFLEDETLGFLKKETHDWSRYLGRHNKASTLTIEANSQSKAVGP